jgi:hypothetical protein
MRAEQAAAVVIGRGCWHEDGVHFKAPASIQVTYLSRMADRFA